MSTGPSASVSGLSTRIGETVTLKGWLYNRRDSGKIRFLVFRDGSGYVQCVVVKKEVPEEVWAESDRLTQESSLEVTGVVREAPRQEGGVEIGVTALSALSVCHDWPITPKEHGVDFLMSQRHLWLRSSKQVAILKVRSEVESAIHDFYHSRGFTKVDSPILTPNACEGTSNLFETQYTEEEKAYLSQSGQLYLEPAAAALGKVYCFGPTFRAEKSKTRRHLTEFWMVEPEMAFATLEDYLDVAEGMVSYVAQQVLEKNRIELQTIERDVSKLEAIVAPFPRLSYDDAVDFLQNNGFPDFPWGEDFGAPHETAISEQYDRPVFVYHYPTQVKAFYMEPVEGRPEVCRSADLLAPEGYGEIIGGGQRMTSLELLEQRLEEHRLPREAYEWYLDLRKYGSVPHSGFGLGIERTVAWLCGLEHVRETIPYPRMLEKIYP